MEVLSDRVDRKRVLFETYVKSLSGLTFQPEPIGARSNRWLTTVLFPNTEIRERVREALLAERIESRPLWKPMHLQPVFQSAQVYGGQVSANLFGLGLCLPSGTAMNSAVQAEIIEIICDVIN